VARFVQREPAEPFSAIMTLQQNGFSRVEKLRDPSPQSDAAFEGFDSYSENLEESTVCVIDTVGWNYEASALCLVPISC
jgi:hypothetical protein